MPLVEDDHEHVDSKAAFLSVDTMVCSSLLQSFSFKSLSPAASLPETGRIANQRGMVKNTKALCLSQRRNGLHNGHLFVASSIGVLTHQVSSN